MCKKLVSGVVALFVAVLVIAPFYTRAEGIDYSYGLFDPQTETLYYPDEYSVSNYGYIFNVFDISLKIWIGRDVNVLNDVPHYETVGEGIYFLQITTSNINFNINPSGKYYISSSRMYRLYKLKSDVFEWVEVSSYMAGVSSENAYFGFSTTNFQDFNNLIYSPRDILWNGTSDIAIDANPTETNPHSNNIQQLPKITLNTQVEFVIYLQAMMMLAAGMVVPMVDHNKPKSNCEDCGTPLGIQYYPDIGKTLCSSCSKSFKYFDKDDSVVLSKDHRCRRCKKYFDEKDITYADYESTHFFFGFIDDIVDLVMSGNFYKNVALCKSCKEIWELVRREVITLEEAIEMSDRATLGQDSPIINNNASGGNAYANADANASGGNVGDINVNVNGGESKADSSGELFDFRVLNPQNAKTLMAEASETFEFFASVFRVFPTVTWTLISTGFIALIVAAVFRRFLW